MTAGLTERETILQISDSFKRASSDIKLNNFAQASENLKTAASAIKHLGVIQQKSDLNLIGIMVDHVQQNCFNVSMRGIQLGGMDKARFGNLVEGLANRCKGLWEARSVARVETLEALNRFSEKVGGE